MQNEENSNLVLLSTEGYVDDLLNVSDDGVMVGTRFFIIDGCGLDEDSEVMDISVVSTNVNGKHPVFDRLKGKKVRITVQQI